MRSSFFSHLVNGPFGDPALFVRAAHQREALLFDCGDLHALSPRDILKIQRVFISHGHIDHLIGFDHLLRNFLYRETPLTLYGPPGLIASITHRLASYTWNLIEGYPLEITVCDWAKNGQGRAVRFRATHGFEPEDERPFSCRDGVLCETPLYQVRTLPLSHGDITSLAFVLEERLHVAIHRDALDALGYRTGKWLTEFKHLVRSGAGADMMVEVPMEGEEKNRLIPLQVLAGQIAHLEAGMKIAYVTDCSPTTDNFEKVVDLAVNAHLLVIEATFTHDELSRARERNHLTARHAGELARRCGAQRLLLFHHSPRHQDAPERLRDEAFAAYQPEKS